MSKYPCDVTTYLLGAGFSRPAGLPLGQDIFPSILELSKRTPLYGNVIKPDLERYVLFVRRATGERLRFSEINLEKFMSFLDVEHTLRLSGKNTWTDQGNKTQLVVRNLIAELLLRRQRLITPEARQLYDDFARRLTSMDYVITFNYDTLLEESLDRVGVKYRLFPSRYREIDEWGGGTLPDQDDEVVILKMHGSIDWFDRSSFEQRCEEWRKLKHGTLPPDEIFADPDHQLTPLIDGLYPPSSPLTHIYRLRTLNRYLSFASLVRDAPVIISPSFNKILYINPVREFWYSFGGFGSWAPRLVIIGFSLPAHDEYIRQAIYSLVRNYQHFKLGRSWPKSKLRMVDFRQTPEAIAEYRQTYAFVDWKRTKVFFDGLTREALPSIMGSAA